MTTKANKKKKFVPSKVSVNKSVKYFATKLLFSSPANSFSAQNTRRRSDYNNALRNSSSSPIIVKFFENKILIRFKLDARHQYEKHKFACGCWSSGQKAKILVFERTLCRLTTCESAPQAAALRIYLKSIQSSTPCFSFSFKENL